MVLKQAETQPSGVSCRRMSSFNATPNSPTDPLATAHRLATAGHVVDINGVVAHQSHETTVMLTGVLGAIGCLTGLVWSIEASVGLLAILLSAITDSDGGQGWVRQLVTRGIDHTIVVWPGPSDVDEPDRPSLLVTAPLPPTVALPFHSSRWMVGPIVGCLLGILALAGQPLWGASPAIATAIALVMATVALRIRFGLVTAKRSENPARSVWEHAVLRRPEAPTHVRVIWALVAGDPSTQNGLSTLLLNHSHRIVKNTTRIVCLNPSDKPLSLVTEEGWVRTRTADGWFHTAANELELATQPGTSAALTAVRLGWRAAALNVAADQQHRAQHMLQSLIAHADAAAKNDAW